MELSFSGGYQQFWKAIIRPPRDDYEFSHLGSKYISVHGTKVVRNDYSILNSRGLKIECSHFDIEPECRPTEAMPCVVFLHGNASSRLEGIFYLDYLIPIGCTLFVFDFCGCGKSQGDYISLGWHERDDVDAVVEFLRHRKDITRIGLWGRSMGAATSTMYTSGDRTGKISAVVVDSPFACLREVCTELCSTYANIPSFIAKGALKILRGTIKEKAKFDINLNNPKEFATTINHPFFIIHGKDDDFILPHHSHEIFNALPSKIKSLKIVDGDHNSTRSDEVLKKISEFFKTHLICHPPIPRKSRQNAYENINVDNKKPKVAIFNDDHLDSKFFANHGKDAGLRSSMFMSKIFKTEENDIKEISKAVYMEDNAGGGGGNNGYPFIDDNPGFQKALTESIYEYKRLKTSNTGFGGENNAKNENGNKLKLNYPTLD